LFAGKYAFLLYLILQKGTSQYIDFKVMKEDIEVAADFASSRRILELFNQKSFIFI
jgi:hypothetical protein